MPLSADAIADFGAAIDLEPRFYDFHKRRGQALAGALLPGIMHRQDVLLLPIYRRATAAELATAASDAASPACLPACLPLQRWGMTRGLLGTCAALLSWQGTTPPRRVLSFLLLCGGQ